MADDSELLCRYCQERSEAAFTELVGRHFNMVYFAAFRRVGGDAHLAQDVSQAVFTRLAIKAPALAERASIAGWLYNCTCFVAARQMRSERRWQARQAQAQTLMEINAAPADRMDWERLMPVIDEALNGLGEWDRELVLLRYFQENSFIEISAREGLSADAARFRLNRALEKMRTRLARRGIESTSAALGLVLAGQAQADAPTGAAATIAKAAFAAQASAAGVLPLTHILMSITKLKAGIFAVIAVAVIGTLVVRDVRRDIQIRDLQRQFQSLQSEHERLAAQTQPNVDPKSAGAQLIGLRSKLEERQTRSADPQSNSRPGLKPKMKAIASATNAGVATPFASLETEIWANYTGNVDALAKMITFVPEAKDAADKLWASLPAEVRSQFPTPESVVATLMAEAFPSDFMGYQVTGDQQNGPTPDYWLLQFQYQKSDGTTVDNRAVALQQINGNWMVMVGANGVQRLAARFLSGTAPASN
jgi:RNA polymerase sigma factor (sigma-70 family)